MRPPCVWVLDDHPLIALGLAQLLTPRGIDVRGVDPGVDLDAAGRERRPDLVVLDLDLGTSRGDDEIPGLVELGVDVLVMTGVRDEARIGRCLGAGAVGYVDKALGLAEVTARIVDALAGRPVNGRAELESLRALAQETDAENVGAISLLTNREREVLQYLVDGYAPNQIASAAYVGLATVRSHIRAILTKLGVNSQLAAVAVAVAEGWRPRQPVAHPSE